MFDPDIDSMDVEDHDRSPDAEDVAKERSEQRGGSSSSKQESQTGAKGARTWNLGVLESKIFRLCSQDRAFLADSISSIKPEYFEKNIFGDLFALYRTTYLASNAAPTRDMAESHLRHRFADDGTGMTALLDACFAAEPIAEVERTHIVSEAASFSRREGVKSAFITAMGLVNDGEYERAADALNEAVAIHPFEDARIGDELFDNMDDMIAEVRVSLEGRMNTGYSSINGVLNGGWGRKELVCVMAPPGLGKSIFLVNWGLAAIRHGYSVVHYTLEMSRGMLALRYYAAAAQVQQAEVLASRDKLEKARSALRATSQARLHLKEFPTSGASVLDLKADLDRRARSGFTPDIVIVDYGDIMVAAHERCKSPYEEQGWIFRELRRLAIERNVAMITATQAKREALSQRGGTANEVGMDMTADSMEKNRILDALFSIRQSPQEKKDGAIVLSVAKNRNGPMGGLLSFRIDYLKMTIKDFSDEMKEQLAKVEAASTKADWNGLNEESSKLKEAGR